MLSAVISNANLIATADYRLPIFLHIEWCNLPPLSHPSPPYRVSGVAKRGMLQHCRCRNIGLA